MKMPSKLASYSRQSKMDLAIRAIKARVLNRHVISRDARPPLIAASINRKLAPHQRTKRLLTTPKPN
jgi:hypothetical protein